VGAGGVSEASRIRRLFLLNRLEELLAKHGPPDIPPPMGAECEPTWGPVGSLAQQWMDQEVIDHILALDRDMARSARKTAPEQAPSGVDVQPATEQAPPQNRVLEASAAMRHLDRHGETPLFRCPVCSEESAKASAALDYWRCTACSTWGKASRLPGVNWVTPVHIV
jgi:hypothetical protein